MSTTDILDREIRSLVAELMAAAPPAPTLAQLEWGDLQGTGRDRRRRGVPFRWLVSGSAVGAVVTVTLLVVFLLPSLGQRPAVAAAAQLRQIAAKAAGQRVLRLGPDQWLMTKQVLSASLAVTQIGSRSIAGAQASVTVTGTQWFDDFGQACISNFSGPAQFVSTANRTAWHSIGLTDLPAGQPMTSCPSFVGADDVNGFAAGIGAVDVETLTKNPSVLAHELENGTTGVAGLDQPRSGGDPAFQQVATLLIGPLTGTTPAFHAELYRTLALLPGIRQLGPMTTHSGATGLGFSTDSDGGRDTIIVDPDTGALLEARNIQPRTAAFGLHALVQSYATPTSAVTSHGTQANVAIVQWLDPVGAPTIVDTDDLPSDLSPAPPPTALITATGKHGVSAGSLTDLENTLVARFGAPAGGWGYDPSAGGGILSFTFRGSRTQVRDFAQALRRSPLIASVNVNFGQ